ncbi:hypothetical protein QR685DRAFT_599863 [Neurospora intermedia]|uniref:Heterokaryon incompatibility domain-containing protein n=1 Tax=Neurospora intermedia TaxID=5142 RepID=A0ABR3D361_NEUIN
MANRESLLDSGTENAPISVSGPQSGQRTVAAVAVLTTLTSPPTMDGEMVRLRARSASTANRYLAMEVTAWGTTGTHNGLKEPYRASY